MIEFEFADLHCHPTLKTYGRSFDKPNGNQQKSDIWYQNKPTYTTLFIQRLLGITRFSQADLSSMAQSRVRYAFVSLYPFEKGFFFNPRLPDRVAARLATWVTSIGYHRVRYLQEHNDYYRDLIGEFRFLENSQRGRIIDDIPYKWDFLDKLTAEPKTEDKSNQTHVIPTIEGAHILNTGLGCYGRKFMKQQVFDNIKKLKQLPHPPAFITFAHNFNNDLCGHAPSLTSLNGVVDQSENLGKGFTSLGWQVLERLLETSDGHAVYIDLKHMSLISRQEFYTWHKNHAPKSPILVSHGAFTGCRINGNSPSASSFATDEINFFDDELVYLAGTGGLFGLQFDANRLARKKLIRKSVVPKSKETRLNKSAGILWNQIRHAAEVLDAHGLPAWDTLCIGSDFDGTINPLDGIWSAREFNLLANELLGFATAYLEENPPLLLSANREIAPETVIRKFSVGNAERFLRQFWISRQ
jgi:microsomal dipeptidase-like Zn-dependent dipeptidase